MNSIPDSFLSSLESILKELLPKTIRTNGKPKVIHDAIWGSKLFFPWEIALLDTPLCQRLRGIYQLGSTFLTYPSAIHNRFSHTLGVISLSGRLINSLIERGDYPLDDFKSIQKDRNTVRLAGLLHDIGHCFFSHVSESILKPYVIETQNSMGLGHAKTHEFFSYLIIKHPFFQNFWKKNILPLINPKNERPCLDDIANIIVGIPPSEEKRYLQEIISGPYDVDKLEYIYRDSKMAGIEISYDIERYFYKICIVKENGGTNRLVMNYGGERVIEQIIFSKMMLFSFLYHHQKVLAADCIIYDLLFELVKNGKKGSFDINHPLDFLKYNDFDILARTSKGPSEKFEFLKNKLLSRDLPKRALTINRAFVNDLAKDEEIIIKYSNFRECASGLPEDVLKLRNEIVTFLNNMGTKATIDDIYINFPSAPSIDESNQAPVITIDEKIDTMSKHFVLKGWHKIYELKKLCGYIFVSEKIMDTAPKEIHSFLSNVKGLLLDKKSLNRLKEK